MGDAREDGEALAVLLQVAQVRGELVAASGARREELVAEQPEVVADAEEPARLRARGEGRKEFFVSQDCHPQTLAVLHTRAEPLGVTIRSGPKTSIKFPEKALCGLLLQYPTSDGYVGDVSSLVAQAHEAGVLVVVATDLLALTLLTPQAATHTMGFWQDIAAHDFAVPAGASAPAPRSRPPRW